MVRVRTVPLERASSKVREDGKHLHISGQPGIGKTQILQHLQDDLEDDYTVKTYSVPSYKGPYELHQELLHLIRDAAPLTDATKNKTTGGSASLPVIGGSAGASFDDRASHLQKIADLTRDWSDTPLVLCIDDIHKLLDDQRGVQDAINELAAALGENVHLITAGRISGIGQAADHHDTEEFHLKLYTREQTRRFLESAFTDVSDDTVQQVHSKLEGHPLYLSLLTEASDDESDLTLPENKVLDKIEARYFNTLPKEEQRFLREVAPLPELDEKTCAGIIDDYTPVKAAEMLQQLNQRTLLQRVNRTDEGDNIYKIHSLCRNHLTAKHHNEDAVYRAAFQFHIQQLGDVLTSDADDKLEVAVPHWTYVNYFLQKLYNGDPDPEDFRDELDRLDIELPARFFIVVFAGLGSFQEKSVQLWRQELDVFQDWVHEIVEVEQQAELTLGLLEWFLSQFEEEPMDLSEVQIPGSIDDLPDEYTDIDSPTLSDDHVTRLQKCFTHTLQFFFIDEPFQSKLHREHVVKALELHGTSPAVIREFRETLLSVIQDSNLQEEFVTAVEDMQDSVVDEFDESLTSSLDVYEMRDQMMESAQEMLETFHLEALVESGLVEDLILEGGKVLEQAENPAFAMFLYGIGVSYAQEQEVELSAVEEIKERYREQLAARREYERGLENPIVDMRNSEGVIELEDSEAQSIPE